MSAVLQVYKGSPAAATKRSHKKKHSLWEGRQISAGAGNSSSDHKITQEVLAKFRKDFTISPLNTLVANALAEKPLHEIAKDRQARISASHLFTHKIETHPIASNQKKSGRCWLFAGLNCARIAMIQKYNLPNTFEFSQNFLYFFDQLEKANVFLTRMIDWSDRSFTEGDVIQLLSRPVKDGGGWVKFAGLVQKYGLVPKSSMPESFHSSNTAQMQQVLNYQLRQFTLVLREMSADHAAQSVLIEKKNEMMETVYRILSDFLGEPPSHFDWEYETKNGDEVHSEKNLTPIDFYEKFVPYDVNDKIQIINMPLETTPYGKCYARWCSNNLVEGPPETFLNLPYEKIVPYAIESIRNGEPVYFTSDVRQQFMKQQGSLDCQSYSYESVFTTPFSMTKTERVQTVESSSRHVMVLCGVNLTDEEPNRWQVENSWGKKKYKNGYLSMTHEWFLNYTFKFVIDRKYLPEEIHLLAEQKPVQMTRTDRM